MGFRVLESVKKEKCGGKSEEKQHGKKIYKQDIQK